MKTDYIPTIGLEIHAELSTKTKMFCNSCNVQESEDVAPNTHICPICMGHPGTLPSVNKKAVESVIMVGLALDGTIASYTEFDRKNYFYPDIPKGYQISQYAYPLVTGGSLKDIAITRVHLEEDTARSQHDSTEGSLVDYNRAGVPLMELVTEPVIHDAKTAGDFARELQLLLRTLGVSRAQMEKGQMRVEANISVSKGSELGTKVEVKNLNSFRSVEMAIDYEVARQVELLEAGESVVQETRGWDEDKGRTFSQRKKESSHDYRYFPDPDIPKINLSVSDVIDVSRLAEIMPEKPSNKRIKYLNLGIPSNQVEILVGDLDVSAFFEKSSVDAPKDVILLLANYLTSDVQGMIVSDSTLSLETAHPGHFASLIALVASGDITSRVVKDLLREVVFEGAEPKELIKERGLAKPSREALVEVVTRVLSEQGKVVEEYRAGKTTAIQFLVGQCMRYSQGAGDPGVFREILESELAK